MDSPRILIAGVGNIFCGDDAFGSEVARRLMQRPWPDGVRVVDFGIRSIDLTYALLEDLDVALLIDAAPRGLPAGTLSLIEPDVGTPLQDSDHGPLEGHALDLVHVLRLARSQGSRCAKVLLLACEPAELGGDEGRLGLTPEVEAAVNEAVPMVERLVADLFVNQERTCTSSPSP